MKVFSLNINMTPFIVLLFLVCIVPTQGTAKTLRIASHAKYIGFDPMLSYEWLGYQTLTAMCGFLMTPIKSKSDSFKLVLDIAENLEYRNNNKTLVFTIKKGNVFHNGKEITAHDIVASLNRATHPKLGSPGAAFFKDVLGYSDYQSGEKDNLSGVQVLDTYTLKIDLSRPSYAFLFALTTNFACILPKETPIKPLELPIISSGAYRFESFENNILTLKFFDRSEERKFSSQYSKIQIITGLSVEETMSGFASNQYDIILDGLAWAGTNNRKEWEQKNNFSYSTTYLTMNTKIPPFNDVRVRQAVNFGIDREKLIDILSGAATKTSHIVPPAFPEFKLMKDIYHYNPSKAKALLLEKNSGKKPLKRLHANLYALDTDLYRKLIHSVVADLQKIGLNITPHFIPHKELLSVAGRKVPGQIIFSDGLGWIADFPEISNFYTPLLSKEAIDKDGWNWAHYYNEDVEQLSIKADSLVNDNDKRAALWVKAFSKIEQDAPWAALYNRRATHILSPKITGTKSFTATSDQLIWILSN